MTSAEQFDSWASAFHRTLAILGHPLAELRMERNAHGRCHDAEVVVAGTPVASVRFPDRDAENEDAQAFAFGGEFWARAIWRNALPRTPHHRR